MTVERAAVIGVGLIGGSAALAIKRAGLARVVVGAGRTGGSLDRARRLGAVDEAAPTAADAVRGASIVLLAPPAGRIAPLLAEIAPHVAVGALVTDAGSTKSRIVEAAERSFGPGGARAAGGVFVGAHPLAGSERAGVAAARASLFDGATIVVTPATATPLDAVERATSFWEALGGHVQLLGPAEHDRLLAATSHMPQAVASALMRAVAALAGAGRAAQFSGAGLRDTTRLAGSAAHVWSDILLENRAHVVPALGALRRELDALEDALGREDRAALEAWLAEAQAARAALDGAARA